MQVSSRERFGALIRWPEAAAWVVGILLLGQVVKNAWTGQYAGQDLRFFRDVAVLFRHHQSVYTHPGFLFPPSSMVFIAPLAYMPVQVAHAAHLVLSVSALLVGAALTLRICGCRVRSGAGAMMLVALGCFAGVEIDLEWGNYNTWLLLAEVGVLAFATRGRWALAGACLGASLALKPGLVVLLLFFAAWRQWRGLLVAVAVPVLLSLAVSVLMFRPAEYITLGIPYMLSGESSALAAGNVSIAGFMTHQGVAGAALAVRVFFAVPIAWLLWVIYRRRGQNEHLAQVQFVGVLVLAEILLASFAWNHYGIWLIPLMATVGVTGAVTRSVLAWVGIYLSAFAANSATPFHGTDLGGARRYTAAFVLVLVGLFSRAVTDRSHAVTPSGRQDE